MREIPAAVSHRTTDWRFTVGVITGGHFLSHFYLLAFPPLFPLLRTEFGLNNAQLGLLVTAVSIGSFLQVPVGVLVDRAGGKRLFLFAIGLTSVGIMLAGVGPTYYTVLAFALLAGLGQAAFHPADYALLDAATEGDNEGKSFGVHTFGGYAGFATAPVVLGGIGFVYGWRPALLATGAAGLAYLVFAAVTLDPVHQRHLTHSQEAASESEEIVPNLREILTSLVQSMILVVTAFFVFFSVAMAGIKSFAPVLSVDVFGVVEETANITLTAFFAMASVSVLIGGLLADRYNPYRLIVGNMTLAAVLTWGIVSNIVPVTTLVIIGFFAMLGLFTGLAAPARDRLVNSVSEAGSAGKSFGLAFTGGTLGATVSPVVLGAVIDAGSPRMVFLLIGVFFMLGGLVVTALGFRVGRATPQPAD